MWQNRNLYLSQARLIVILLASTSTIVSSFSSKIPTTSFTNVAAISRRTEKQISLLSATPDLEVVALVAGQENYGLAIVCVGEALWSFSKAPSLDHAKVLVPAAVAALVLVVVSGPLVISGDPDSITTGLEVATAVSVALGATYVLRLFAPYSPSPKEIAFLGLLVAIAGFFSFSQNLLVDGFVVLPSLPIPQLPSLSFPTVDLPF